MPRGGGAAPAVVVDAAVVGAGVVIFALDIDGAALGICLVGASPVIPGGVVGAEVVGVAVFLVHAAFEHGEVKAAVGGIYGAQIQGARYVVVANWWGFLGARVQVRFSGGSEIEVVHWGNGSDPVPFPCVVGGDSSQRMPREELLAGPCQRIYWAVVGEQAHGSSGVVQRESESAGEIH